MIAHRRHAKCSVRARRASHEPPATSETTLVPSDSNMEEPEPVDDDLRSDAAAALMSLAGDDDAAERDARLIDRSPSTD